MSRITRRGFLQTATVAAAGASTLRAQAIGIAPAFLRCPNVQNTGPNEATILWALPSLQTATVSVTDPSGKVRIFDAVATLFDTATTSMDQTYYQYRAILTGLTRATTYTYQILVNGAALSSPLKRALQFSTEAPGPFRFLHFADSGEGSAQQIQLGREMAAEDVSFVLANGDLAYDLATHSSIEDNYYAMYREMMAQVPFFATLGNHEYYTDSGNPSLSGRAHRAEGVASHEWGRYYSFDWGNAHFVALDTNAPLERAANGKGGMLQWLEQDLRNTRKFWRIAFFHHPGYATGKHQDEPEAERVRQHIVPILEANGVHLVFNGHEHTYQRTYELRGGQVVPANAGGIVYVTSGGGGAQPSWSAPNERIAQSIGKNHFVRTEVTGSSLMLRTRGLSEAVDLDALTLRPQPRITGVVNSATFTSQIASGGAVTIFGSNLFPEAVAATGTPLLEAHGCSVLWNGKALPLVFADAMQINTELPAGVSDSAKLQVITPNGSTEITVQVSGVAPALFANPQSPEFALAVSAGSLVNTDSPAASGAPISLFMTGLGTGAGVHVRVKFQDVEADATSVTPQGGGIYQVQIPVPLGLQSDSASVEVVADGVRSNVLSLPIL